MKIIPILALALFLSACGVVAPAQRPTDAEFAAADAGPAPANAEQLIRSLHHSTLKDPDSALYRAVSKPEKFWMGSANNRAGAYGWLVCAEFNAKNSMGGYVGYKRDGFVIRDGVVIAVLPEGRYAAQDQCAGRS